jgi:hypothetical protein
LVAETHKKKKRRLNLQFSFCSVSRSPFEDLRANIVASILPMFHHTFQHLWLVVIVPQRHPKQRDNRIIENIIDKDKQITLAMTNASMPSNGVTRCVNSNSKTPNEYESL